MKHKHAELIKAWADGHTIERLWTDINHPTRAWWMIDYQPDWDEYLEYRIKPEPKPDVIRAYKVKNNNAQFGKNDIQCHEFGANLKLIFDGETGELKSAEVLK